RISAVGGPDTPVPPGAEVIDARGKWVLPGFVEAHAHLGVHEDGEGWSGDDTNEMTDANGARFRAIDGIDIEDIAFQDALGGGVTTAVVKPGSGNPIGGRTVAIKAWGERTADEQGISDTDPGKYDLGENPKPNHRKKKKPPTPRRRLA